MSKEFTVEQASGGVGFILRDESGNVVREHHGQPLGALTRRAAEHLARDLERREREADELDREIAESLA